MRVVLRVAAGVVAVVVAIALAASWWLLRPEVLEAYVLDSIEERTGVHIEVARLRLGLAGVVLENLEIFEPENPAAAEAAPLVLSAKRLTVRPQWRALLDRRIVISYAALEGLDLSIRRESDGSSNLERLVEAFASAPPENESTAASPPAEAETPEEAAFDLTRVAVRTSRIAYLDEHERPTNPLRIGLVIDELRVWNLATPTPASFDLSAEISVGRTTRSRVRAHGTLKPSPLVIDTDVELSEVDVDTLVPDVHNPDDPTVPGPLPLEGIRVDGRLAAEKVVYQGFVLTDAKATATLDGTSLVAGPVTANLADGTVQATADVDFGVQGFEYAGTAAVKNVDLAKAGGLLEPIAWGRAPSPRLDADVQLSMAGTTAERLLDTIDLRGDVHLDSIDVVTTLALAEPSEPRDVGPFDTGAGRMAVTAEIDRALWGPYSIDSIRAETTLTDSHLTVPSFDATFVGGSAKLTAHVDLTRPGLAYDGTLRVHDADVAVLGAGITAKGWGTRTGLAGIDLTASGHGTDTRTLVRNLQANGHVTWTNGTVSNSEYLDELADVTGIPGFRNLVVQNSGGSFEVKDGVFSTDRMRVWGPHAGVQAAGTIDTNLDVDAEVALGIGPDSNRELFSTGIALPYVQGDGGWRFVPVNVRGNVMDPTMTVPPRAVLKSALTTVPAASAGVVSTGLGAVRGGTRAVLEGTRAILPGSDPAIDETESAIDSGTGLVGGVVRDGASAIGSMFDGLFDDEAEDGPSRPKTETKP